MPDACAGVVKAASAPGAACKHFSLLRRQRGHQRAPLCHLEGAAAGTGAHPIGSKECLGLSNTFALASDSNHSPAQLLRLSLQSATKGRAGGAGFSPTISLSVDQLKVTAGSVTQTKWVVLSRFAAPACAALVAPWQRLMGSSASCQALAAGQSKPIRESSWAAGTHTLRVEKGEDHSNNASFMFEIPSSS